MRRVVYPLLALYALVVLGIFLFATLAKEEAWAEMPAANAQASQPAADNADHAPVPDVAIEFPWRKSFRRGEEGAVLQVTVKASATLSTP